MDTAIVVNVLIEFSLADREAREALETNITNFIAGQEAGSVFKNLYREDDEDIDKPFWFRTMLHIVTPSIADVASIRNTLITALDTQFTGILKFEFEMKEKGIFPAVVEPPA